MDPGIDDALAMMAALHCMEVDAVSTVAGNVTLEHTYDNARFLLNVAGCEHIPVLAGAQQPLFYPLAEAKDIHGTTGLGGYAGQIPHHELPAEHSWTWLANYVARHPHPGHLISTGPLTNLAILFLAHPDTAEVWDSVTCMFGSLPGTRVDRQEEFNVYGDPHAADIVLQRAQNLQIIGINVAHRALLPVADITRFKRYGRTGELLFQVMTFYGEQAKGEGGDLGAFPVDDVLTVAAVDSPELFKWVELPLAVVCEGPLRGTVVVAQGPANRPLCKIASDIDQDGFIQWLWACFDQFGSQPVLRIF